MTKPRTQKYQLRVSRNNVRHLNENFLSFTIDASLIIGGHWWGTSKGTRNGLSRTKTSPLSLANPLLRMYTRLLGPAFLRVGGTEADRIRYGFYREDPASGWAGSTTTPAVDASYTTPEQIFTLKKKLWKQLADFCQSTGLGLLFTVAAGPEARDQNGNWLSQDTERLLRYTARKKIPVAAWELGNEVNAYPFLWGLKHRVSARQYAHDFGVFAAICQRWTPQALRVGPASAVWPLIGEPHPLIPQFCRSSEAQALDVLSFHFYPQQSRRGRFAVRRAKPYTLLNSRILDSARRPVKRAQQAAQGTAAQNARIWITESGHALYGGEPGISNTFLSTLWWLDQLALYAVEGVDVVFRQSLVGSDYGLLEEKTLRPRPDFYASFLWKKLIRSPVYEPPQVNGKNLRAWAFGGDQRIWLIVINLNRHSYAHVEVGQPIREKIVLSAPKHSPELLLVNGKPALPRMLWDWDHSEVQRWWGLASPKESEALDHSQTISLPPLSCAFLSLAP